MMLFHLAVLFVVDAVVADPSRCNECIAYDSATCLSDQRADQSCVYDRESLGTTHCASAVGKIMNKRGNVTDVFFRGCISCSSKVEACFALGGIFKDESRTLLQCEMECCTSDNCNNKFPSLSESAITVFTPNAPGPVACLECFTDDAEACFSSQKAETCRHEYGTLGTTHCGSAVGIYIDRDGNTKRGFFRSCIDCTDKKAACAVISGYLAGKDKRFFLPDCEIECCTATLCNRQLIPTQSIPTNTGHQSMTPPVLGNWKFRVFVLAVSIILHHF